MTRGWLAALVYVALTALFTWPLPYFFFTHHVGESGGDARIYLWNLWWVRKALVDLHANPLRTDYIFYPVGIGLALHTLALLHGGLNASDVVVFEDTEAGVASAKAAGMRCFAVLGTLRADRLAAADEIVPAIDVELMQRLLG